MDMRIDVVQKSFLAYRAHYENVVFIDLSVELFLRAVRHFFKDLGKFRLVSRFRDHSVENRTHSHGHLVLGRPCRKRASASMAMYPAHGVDRTSCHDYKKIIVYTPQKT